MLDMLHTQVTKLSQVVMLFGVEGLLATAPWFCEQPARICLCLKHVQFG